MKKALSIILTVIMLTSVLSLFAIPASATEESAPATGKVLTMYVADSGDDTNNDGLSAEKPKKTINNAVNYMKTIVGPTSEYTSAELVLVGDVTIAKSTQTYVHPDFALTVRSANKDTARLLLQHNFRIGGETLYTNIKILFTATANQDLRHLMADGNKLTIGLPGVPDDVITYEAGVSTRRLSIAGGFPGWQDPAQEIESIDVTLNSGEYRVISTGAAHAGSLVKGDINFVINEGVKVVDGVIALGGSMKTQTSAKDDTGLRCGGDYNVTINGGTFVNTNILIGALKSGNAGYRPCSVAGNTTIDINGGTFTNCKLDTYETLGGVASGDLAADALGVDFKNGITVDFTDIPTAKKAEYVAMVGTANTAPTLTKNKITVVEHSLTKFEDTNDDQHKASCPCGCGLNEMQNHAYDAGEVTKQPSHSTEGEKTYTCSVCNGTKIEKIAPDTTTHNYTTGWVKADDTNHKKTCDDPSCPDTAKGLVTEAHTWNEGEITKEATHLEEGEKTYTCSVCNGTKTEVVPKTEVHSMGDWQKHDANQHKRACACGEAKYQDHDWGTGKVTKEATADAEGEKTFTCATCGETKTEAIAKLAAETEAEAEGGCGSVVGLGVVAIVAASAAFAFVPKKKEN